MADIKLLDCTLRDGGYVNDWQWGFGSARRIIQTLTGPGQDGGVVDQHGLAAARLVGARIRILGEARDGRFRGGRVGGLVGRMGRRERQRRQHGRGQRGEEGSLHVGVPLRRWCLGEPPP